MSFATYEIDVDITNGEDVSKDVYIVVNLSRNLTSGIQDSSDVKKVIRKTITGTSSNDKITVTMGLFDKRFPGSTKISVYEVEDVNTAVSYYYTKKDNVVRVISYAWNEQDDNQSIQKIFDTNKKLFTKKKK